MTMRIEDETKRKLERIKKLYNLSSLDEAVEYLIKIGNPIEPKLYAWIKEIVPFGNTTTYVEWSHEQDHVTATIHTQRNEYRILVHNDGWMNAFVKMPNVEGQKQFITREDFNRETWEAIKDFIIMYELVPLKEQADTDLNASTDTYTGKGEYKIHFEDSYDSDGYTESTPRVEKVLRDK